GIRDLIVTGVQTCALPILGAVCAATTVSNTAMVTAVTACGTSSQKAVASGFSLAAPLVAFTVVKTITSANLTPGVGEPVQYTIEIGRASCRERVQIAAARA